MKNLDALSYTISFVSECIKEKSQEFKVEICPKWMQNMKIINLISAWLLEEIFKKNNFC